MNRNNNDNFTGDVIDADDLLDEVHSVIVAKDLLPDTLPVYPLFQRPLFPRMMVPIIIEKKDLVKEIVNRDKKSPFYMGLLYYSSENPGLEEEEELDKERFAGTGVAAKIIQVSGNGKNDGIQVLVQLMERFDVLDISDEEGPMLRVSAGYWSDTDYEVNEELKAYSVAIVDSIKELVKMNPLFKEGLSILLEKININDPGALSDFAASMTTASGGELQEVLETKSIRSRIEKSLILLKKELEISKLKVEISKRIEDRLSKQQREFFLKEQLKEIKKELGISKDSAESEIDKFRKRMAKLELSEEALGRIEEEIGKLKMLEASSAEYNVTRSYLDWLTVLPWGVFTEDHYDIRHAETVLNEDHYGLDDVKSRILESISVGIIKGDLAGSIILLAGPPGVGKTSVGKSIARSLGRKFYRFSLGGMRDEAEIKGHRRTYIGAMPGKFVQALKDCDTANPVIMLDEIDKIGASFRGDPASALLEVLDPEQNREFLDHYLDVRFDLSRVLFICTANQLETIPAPLLDRMEIIRLAGYTIEEKVEIANNYLLPKQLKEHGLKRGQISISKAVLKEIANSYSREAGVRGLENNLKKIMRKAAHTLVKGEVEKISIKKKDLKEYLGKSVFTDKKLFKKPRIGVVNGLAYTALGGTTLYIEAIPVPSKVPGYKQTGQLGKVMIESSEIAYTYIRSLLKEEKGSYEFFMSNLIHLHVPAGATPKDGPSAGITMACAIYSLIKEIPIIPSVGMTGELTLSGRVMPIGGVKEKAMALKRAGLKKMILPFDNREDFDMLEKHIKEGIEPHFVETFREVLKICFPG